MPLAPQAVSSVSSKRRAPGPSGYLFLSLSKLQTQPLEFLANYWREYGDLVRMPILPGMTIYLATHPDHMEHALATCSERYEKPGFFLKPMGQVQGQGLFSSEGAFWRQQRRLIQPAFQQKQLVKLHGIMWRCVDSLLQEWARKPASEVIDIAAEMTRLTLKVVSLTLFSVDVNGESNRFRSALEILVDQVFQRLTNPLMPPLWVPTQNNRQFRRAKQTVDEIVLEVIRERRQHPIEETDLLSMLLASRDEDTGEGMSDQQLLHEIITLINAGHETTATSLAWTWYLLGTHPEIMAQMQAEVEMVLQGSTPTFENLPKLKYTRRVFDESLRLCPPGMGLAPRAALEDDELDGYHIAKGSILNFAFYYTLRHPEFWDNPEQFDPDRFLSEKVKNRHKYAYMPWGAGPHVCIGKNFAIMETLMILSAIVQRFEVSLVPRQTVEVDPRFTLRPKYGVKVTLREKF
ncbi:MAG: cytochrome P450 [Cyanobacteria bacterium P01_F01_bin.53]